MRLICPNCGAQYDVADDAIPDEGRDVQCSNCGHTWFESPDAPTGAEDDAQDDTPFAIPQTPPAPDAAPRASVTPPSPTPPQPTAMRQQLDPSIADILREEAAREEAVRRAETRDMPERQDELPLSAPARARRSSPDTGTPPATLSAAPAVTSPAPTPAPTVAAATTAGARREMFPDIEEINSTLRSSADRDSLSLSSGAIAEQDRRSGRIGFFGTLFVFALLVLVYANADTIAEAMPALAGPLDAFATSIDQARIRLDTWVQGLLSETQGTP
ncbi:MJ0042 family finger-like domain-containing protein [Loktanella fryxellensis]|uniref:MJ0042 family finger-like domain-containing protein n=1 Tax=Loktanella fryxellensis TaxID=245187 RepID=A0A1H8B1V4_9RHOB|nr:zinc-ribbon domain-containing protein [Loktanella fryxellensis]SEM76084.1 MJ0042 family finger-like domain-containing protein [Loktanella fryxellensis]